MLGVDTLGIYLVQIFLSVIISGYERFVLLKEIIDTC